MEPLKINIPSRYIPRQNETSIYISGGREYCIINKDGKIYAIDNICPHQGASLALGALQGEEVICPLHQWRFNFKTGKCSVDKYDIATFSVEIID